MKYTEGDWSVLWDTEKDFVIASEDITIAQSNIEDSEKLDRETLEGNANLLAGAPKLYKTCLLARELAYHNKDVSGMQALYGLCDDIIKGIEKTS